VIPTGATRRLRRTEADARTLASVPSPLSTRA
jgi:hypothetical protein